MQHYRKEFNEIQPISRLLTALTTHNRILIQVLKNDSLPDTDCTTLNGLEK